MLNRFAYLQCMTAQIALIGSGKALGGLLGFALTYSFCRILPSLGF